MLFTFQSSRTLDKRVNRSAFFQALRAWRWWGIGRTALHRTFGTLGHAIGIQPPFLPEIHSPSPGRDRSHAEGNAFEKKCCGLPGIFMHKIDGSEQQLLPQPVLMSDLFT